MMRKRQYCNCIVFLLAFAPALTCNPADAQTARIEKQGWRLTWHDEFERKGANHPDPSKWELEVGGGGWGNNELEYYTQRIENSREENGLLTIIAAKEDYSGADGVKRSYTSSRLKTKTLFSQAHGRFEARIKLPGGKGIWPAFWLLGDDIGKTGWPSCGEIDIMESIGDATTAYGTLHGPGYSGSSGIQGKYVLSGQKKFQDDFHLFAVEWDPKIIRFFVDNVMYASKTAEDLPPKSNWVFDHPFFIILNLAVGGNWPGNPDERTVFPQTMQIDYVRVYERAQSVMGSRPHNKKFKTR
jgi:beta-glucanase (GH16 family)